MGNNSFSKIERLITTAEFKRIRKKNYLYFNQSPIKIYILQQNLRYSRLGIIIYKKSGKAFFRNKIKRWVREIFRVSKKDFQDKIDILFVVSRGTQVLNLELLQNAFFTALQKYEKAK